MHYVWLPQFWSHFRGTMHCLPQRIKSTLFEIFSNGGCPKGTWSVEKISNNVDFSLWGNRATTWEYFMIFSSETKIMKITHSAHCSGWSSFCTFFFYFCHRVEYWGDFLTRCISSSYKTLAKLRALVFELLILIQEGPPTRLLQIFCISIFNDLKV